jgi:hypothetical protein
MNNLIVNSIIILLFLYIENGVFGQTFYDLPNPLDHFNTSATCNHPHNINCQTDANTQIAKNATVRLMFRYKLNFDDDQWTSIGGSGVILAPVESYNGRKRLFILTAAHNLYHPRDRGFLLGEDETGFFLPNIHVILNFQLKMCGDNRFDANDVDFYRI